MAHEDLRDHCLELLAPMGSVRARRMFGGHGLYIDDLFVAIIAFDNLYLKANAATRPAFEAAGSSPFVYDSKNKAVALGYWTAPADALESPALMAPWARLAIEAALAARRAAKPVKPVKPRAARAAKPARKTATPRAR
jgi:DNA transformation protein